MAYSGGSILLMKASEERRLSVIEDPTITLRTDALQIRTGNVHIFEFRSNDTLILAIGGGGRRGFSVSCCNERRLA